MIAFLIVLASYLMGSIPFGLVGGFFFKIRDPRTFGSKNIGATNILRSGNKKAAAFTLFFDMFKGFLAVSIASYIDKDIVYLAILSVVFGHIFPVYLLFKGGKGVATYVGILFAINIYFGIIFTISWFVTFFISKYSSLSSLVGAASIPIYLLILSQFDQGIFFTIMFVLIFFTHRENIKRLKNKEETKTKIY